MTSRNMFSEFRLSPDGGGSIRRDPGGRPGGRTGLAGRERTQSPGARVGEEPGGGTPRSPRFSGRTRKSVRTDFGRISKCGGRGDRLYSATSPAAAEASGVPPFDERPVGRAPSLDRTARLMGVSQFLVIAGLIFINGFFVAAEFALVKVRTSQIDQLVERGNWAAKLTSKALDHLDAYLSASQLGITVASLALGSEIDKVVHSFAPALESIGLGGGRWKVGTFTFPLATILAFSTITFLHMALGEQAPKSLAIRSAKTIALWTAPVLIAFYYVFFPIIWLLNNASNLTSWWPSAWGGPTTPRWPTPRKNSATSWPRASTAGTSRGPSG